MSERSVFLGGEGRNDLGSRAGHPNYQSDSEPGVLVTLLKKAQPSSWQVGGARDWKSVRKLRVGGASHQDSHTVLGLALDAQEHGCSVLAFVRDRDADTARDRAIREGIEAAAQAYPDIQIIGGLAIPKLEGWVLAMRGVKGTEKLTSKGAERKLLENGIDNKNTAQMVEAAQAMNPAALPEDASSLRGFLSRAKEVLDS